MIKAIVTVLLEPREILWRNMFQLKGVPLKLIDTAGIHHTEDKVEKIGVERSQKALQQADLVCFC